MVELELDLVDDGDRVGARLTVHRDVHLPPAVDPHDIRLDLEGVLDLADVAHEDDRVPIDLDGDVVELLHLRDHGVGDDLVVDLAELGVAGGNEHVLDTQGVDHVQRREVPRFQLVAIDVRQDSSQHAAVDGRGHHALDTLEPVAQLEIRDVVEVLLVQGLAAHGDEAQGDRRRRVEGHDHRRDGARWQVEQVRHRVARHLGHGGFEADVFPEEILDDRDAEHGLRFLALDADGLPGPSLQAAGDVPLHDLRRHAPIEGHDLDRGRLELRQQVGGDLRDRRHAHHPHGQRPDDDHVRVLQSGFDDVHVSRIPPSSLARSSLCPAECSEAAYVSPSVCPPRLPGPHRRRPAHRRRLPGPRSRRGARSGVRASAAS